MFLFKVIHATKNRKPSRASLPMTNTSPSTLPQLWYLLDKRLALIEAAQLEHIKAHGEIIKILDDHENRLRAGMTFTAIMTGSGGLLALIAIIKSFFTQKP